MEGNQNPAAELLDAVNSRETPAQKIRYAAQQLLVPEREGLGESVLIELRRHNLEVDKLVSECDRSVDTLKEAVHSSAASDDLGIFFTAASGAREDVPFLSQKHVRLAKRAVEISESIRAELAKRPDELAAEAERVVASVKKQLCKIGCGPEAQIAWKHGQGAAAEQQFEFLARNGNVHSQAALAAAHDARATVQAVSADIGRYRRLLDEANGLLAKVAVTAIMG